MVEKAGSRLEALNNLGNEDFTHILECIFSFLKDSRFDLFGQLKQVAHVPGQSLSAEILPLLHQCLRDRHDSARVQQRLETAGLVKTRAEEAAKLWDRDIAVMSSQLLRSTLSTNELVDFDWKLAVTVATDEVRDAGATVVQLKLTIRDKQAKAEGSSLEEYKTVMFEMGIPEFYSFYGSLKEAQARCNLLGA